MRKMHRWFGLVLCIFLIGFCVSGIILNHPELFSGINVRRSLMPGSYEYKNWNQGLMRGSIAKGDSVIIYGENGFWLVLRHKPIVGFNDGMPKGVEHRDIKAMTRTRSGEIWAVSNYELYHLVDNRWKAEDLEGLNTRLVDVTSRGDSIVVASRSNLWLSRNSGKSFHQLKMRRASDDDGKVSLLRTVWLVHSGALYGTVGKLIGDAVAIVLLILSVTGVWFFIARKVKASPRQLKKLDYVHRHLGRITIVLTLFVATTGWFLRPPAMIAIVMGRVPPMPWSVLDSDNPWNDKIRNVRYDFAENDWILYTSNGFYSLADLQSTPYPVKNTPKVSYMGLTTFYQAKTGQWLIGSFNGLYLWNRKPAKYADKGTEQVTGSVIPIEKDIMVSGFSNDFHDPILVDYYNGTESPKMPAALANLPMSLHSVALEMHTGRIYTFLGDRSNILYIAIIGLAIIWCLWTGYYRPKKSTPKPRDRKDDTE